MAKLLERPAEQLPDESDTLVHEAPKTIEAPAAPLVLETPPKRRPIRWMRWLAVFVVLIVGAATVAVLVTGDDGSELDPSYATAELNRFTTLSEIGGFDTLDPSYAQAENNRFTTLSEIGGFDTLDPSYIQAENNRFRTLSD
jgi:hypothetical protein